MIECGSRVVVKGKERKKKEGRSTDQRFGDQRQRHADAVDMRTRCRSFRITDPGPGSGWGGVGCVELIAQGHDFFSRLLVCAVSQDIIAEQHSYACFFSFLKLSAMYNTYAQSYDFTGLCFSPLGTRPITTASTCLAAKHVCTTLRSRGAQQEITRRGHAALNSYSYSYPDVDVDVGPM